MRAQAGETDLHPALLRSKELSAPPSPPLTSTKELHHLAISRVLSSMRSQLDESFPLERMADVAFMSPFHFNRVFRNITGIPPCHFLSALRMEAARRLVVMTQHSITDICLEVGFKSLGTFTRRFTDLLGTPPLHLRQLARSLPPSLLPDSVPSTNGLLRMGGVIEGEVDVPSGFTGTIYIGLFPTVIPQRRPLSWAVLTAPGRFSLSPVPDGRFHVFAMGLCQPRRSEDLFLYDSAYRGRQPVWVRNGRPGEAVCISLHPPLATDPPILLTFPALVDGPGRLPPLARLRRKRG